MSYRTSSRGQEGEDLNEANHPWIKIKNPSGKSKSSVKSNVEVSMCQCLSASPCMYTFCLCVSSLFTFFILISSVKSQEGIIASQRCSIENQKGAISLYKVYMVIVPL